MTSNRGRSPQDIRERSEHVRRYISSGPREGKQQAIAALHELTVLALQVRPLDKALAAEIAVALKLEEQSV